MRLPPVDIYRLPLIEPMGHLVLQAAYLDNALYSFIAMLLPFGPDTRDEQVAERLRNWDPAFMAGAIDAAIPDVRLAEDLIGYVGRVGQAREHRHRVVHDAMEVGLDDAPGGGFRVVLLREGYVKPSGKGSTYRQLARITPEDVAELAMELYELRLEIDTFLGRWRELSR